MREIPMSTTLPDGCLDLLAPFVELVANRSVIGLGEPTHGTREAFELKHALIRALAEGGLLRTVAFECGFAAGRLIDGYVRDGSGTARDALVAQDFWCWENTEVLAFIEWLRAHNACLSPDDRISFVGIDVQRVERGLPALLLALEGLAAHGGGACSESLAFVRALAAGGVARGDASASSAVPALLEAAGLLVDPLARALCLNVARYVDVYLNAEHEDGLLLRDEYMADTLLEQVSERPGLTVVWAHNEHVAVNPDFFGSAALGHFLREELGAGYVALGMLFGEGSFLARSFSDRQVREWRVEPAGPGHVEQLFAGKAQGIYGTGSFEKQGMRYRRYLGMLYDPVVARQQPETFRVERPLSDFDLVAWLPVTLSAGYLRPLAAVCSGSGDSRDSWQC
jgi:erythromycin esterase